MKKIEKIKNFLIKNLLIAINLLIIVFLSISSNLFSQVIVFERTDVESKNADFVTATYSFGIDIRLDNIENCSNVSFEISHNQIQHVKLSEATKSKDWGENGSFLANQINFDSVADNAVIAIQTGTYLPANANSPDNPKVIHLEFVVAPSAIHNETLVFSISEIGVTIFKDSEIQLTVTDSFRIQYRIRSFVDVWPGDVDCDGNADWKDNWYLAKQLTMLKSYRGFKRPDASFVWQAQRCIAWDNLTETYADCDGNGMVTVSDHAIVHMNYDSTHDSPCNPLLYDENGNENETNSNENSGFINNSNDNYSNNSDEIAENNEKIEKNSFEITEKTIKIPINIDLTGTANLIGISGIIDYSSNLNVKVIGLEIGEFFDENSTFIYYANPETNISSFFAANSNSKYRFEKTNNTVAYLYVETENNFQPDLTVTDFIGFDSNGNISKLHQNFTSICINETEKNDNFRIIYSDGKIYISNLNSNNFSEMAESSKVKITNLLGNLVAEFQPNNENLHNIGTLHQGVYFATVMIKDKIYSSKFFVLE